ncbi:GGDEF domain-containing protein [Vibrio sp. AK197]|uniref:diguanylate cyclase n=1 Tax=Vibrio olivae TaxID=1243002 RepID=A0ABV5HRD0_9VIBR
MSYSIVTSYWFRLTFPILLLCLVTLGMSNVIIVTQANLGFASNLPFVLFAAVIALGHAFKQSRIAMISTAMLVAYWVIQWRLQVPLATGTTLLELALLAFLFPIAAMLVYSMRDTSLLSKTYVAFLVTLSLFCGWSYLILDYFAAGGFTNVNETFLYIEPVISKLPLILVLYLCAVIGIAAILLLKHNRIIDAVAYSSLVLASTTFIFFHVPYISVTMFSIAAIVQIIYLLSASYELAFNDRLTNIPGRLALDSDLKHLGRKYAIAMVDIDHFKNFNDSYGHDTGDDVLKLVAAKLQEVGGKARVYRYGGEEFTILFKGKTVKEAKPHLETLRENIAGYEMTLRDTNARPKNNRQGTRRRGKNANNQTVNVTVSIGVCDNRKINKVEDVIKGADRALYKAKDGGRNQVAGN